MISYCVSDSNRNMVVVPDDYLRYCLSNPWIGYGLGGVLSAGVTYVLVALFLEMCLYSDFNDAALQANLPILFAGLLVRGHPYSMYLMIAARIADNVHNHSGLDSPLLNLLFLKVLPFRGSVTHHDSHHRFSNYTSNAKNYGEYFWIWDYMFGTYSKTSMMSNTNKVH